MRAALVALLLAGCYQPATESCYYRCASSANNACPSGLECNAGMCVTPGEQCPTGTIDAPDPDAVEIDAPPPACGNGTATRGEVCYRTPPIMISPPSNPYDAMFLDRDGDSDLDLLYLVDGTGGGIRHHINVGMAIPLTGTAGPSISNPYVMAAANIDGMGATELVVANNNQVVVAAWNQTTMVLDLVSNLPRNGLVRGALLGNVTNSNRPDLVLVTPSVIELYSIASNFVLASQSISPLPNSSVTDVAMGRLFDLRADLAIASSSGIVTMRGDVSGQFGSPTSTSVLTPVNAIEIGDIDGDNKRDIVYVTADTGGSGGGTLGILFGTGGGAFTAAVTQSVPNLGDALELKDIDGDGRDDILAVRIGSARALAVVLGRSDRTLEPPVFITLPAGMNAQISARGSFNGDTVPDIVVADRGARAVYIYSSDP